MGNEREKIELKRFVLHLYYSKRTLKGTELPSLSQEFLFNVGPNCLINFKRATFILFYFFFVYQTEIGLEHKDEIISRQNGVRMGYMVKIKKDC